VESLLWWENNLAGILGNILQRSKKQVGATAEMMALTYLQEQGLKFITRNFLCRNGEIDLIMTDKSHLVFIEVRFRRSSAYGSAVETITFQKREKIKKTATYYLLKHKLMEKQMCRFDIIAITRSPEGPQFQWIKNAF
jgi:putative endonuclease